MRSVPDLAVTLNVDNIANADLPYIHRSKGAVGKTLGRYGMLGLQKHF